MEKLTAEQILKAMEQMDNDERIKLLDVLAVKHFGFRQPTLEEIEKLNYEALYGDDEGY